jgi:hypothetical protein
MLQMNQVKEEQMMKQLRTATALSAILASLALGGCGGSGRNQSSANGDVSIPLGGSAAQPTTTQPPVHHSKLAGAAVGAVVGHELGHHALAGAAVGAAIQHHRNKKAAAR